MILDPDSYDIWLDPGMQDAAAISELLKPYDVYRRHFGKYFDQHVAEYRELSFSADELQPSAVSLRDYHLHRI